jgi:transposase
MSSKKGKVIFKSYDPNQLSVLPPSLKELIDPNHPVNTVNQVIDKIELDPLLKNYQGGGTSSYHPKMMLKILIYAYLSNIYSSRKIEAALKENIHFMWLAGMNKPDHNTINRFRTEKLKGILKKIFSQVVLLLSQEGHVSLKEAYLDGTKIEANANRYSFVWGNAIKTQKERMAKQLEELWAYAETIAKEELSDNDSVEFSKIDPEKVSETISKIDQALADKKVDKKVKQKLQYAKKNWPKNLVKYQEQEEILAGRKSYSKTDHDATFMRLKEDHMQNGQLKPAYNLQISTCNQFILCYTLHQISTDTTTLIPHLEEFKELYQTLPQTLTADAGYGSEENYEFLENNQVEGYVKYNYFHQDQKKGEKNEDFKYQEDTDSYICQAGQELKLIGERKRATTTGYQQVTKQYQASNCCYCPFKETCSPDYDAKRITANPKLEQYKQKATQRLISEKGLAHRKQRAIDVEPTFAAIKHNRNFKRFMTKGLKNVELEMGLIAIAHNLAKKAA